MCFMMWMMGNGIQIFSIIMTLSGLAQPIVAIAKSHEGEAFDALRSSHQPSASQQTVPLTSLHVAMRAHAHMCTHETSA